MAKICKNSYIPPYIKPDLKWYERDGLMTYIDRLNYEHFEENRNLCLENVQIINYGMIHNECSGILLKKSVREYKTVTNKHFKNMPLKDKDAALGACFRVKRTDLYVEKELKEEYFKTWQKSKDFE